MRTRSLVLCPLVALFLVVPCFAADEEEPETGWKSSAEVGYVVTSGNSEVNTLSFGSETARRWDEATLTFRLGAIRAEQTKRQGFAVGTAGSFVVPTVTEVTADSYVFEGRYDHNISENVFWFGGAGWDRNRPSGIANRYKAFGGVGNIWRDDKKVKFRTDYALSYTDQEDVVETANSVGEFWGVRASWTYRHQLTPSTKYSNDLIADYGIEESDNWRLEFFNGVQVAINSKVALKAGLRLLYNNLPPIEVLDLYDMDPAMGGVMTGTVPYELDELDTIFATSVVVNF